MSLDDHDEQTPLPFPLPRRRRRLSQGIFILPSLVTATALFFGFYSIVHAIQQLAKGGSGFEMAAYLIVIAGFLDGLDGRLARAMKAESDFGMQFDSIADMVSFGVAPAVLAYTVSLVELNRVGWLGAFAFLACAAIRLARFNVMSAREPVSRKYFKGLSSPIAAGGLAVNLLLVREFFPSPQQNWIGLLLTVFLSLLMISNIRFRSFKDISFGRQKLQILLVIMFLLLLIFTFQEYAMAAFFWIYLVVGLVEEFYLFRRRRRSDPSVPVLIFGEHDRDSTQK